MSKSNEMIRVAAQKGYSFTKEGKIINPKGKIIKGTVIKSKASSYKKFGINYKGMSRPILVHRFIAYKMWGELALESECIIHLNRNSLDNRPTNIAIGDYRYIYNETKKSKSNLI
ncbi:hypothetical protein COI68_27180 [Priestia megaterium]|uniref:HNH endonuclease n=1 Tax=Priestia megaterium TaxID=1404 RepID=UPI000BF33D13|nr:HNH endonuclease [Priestia megaterium]PFI59469.1 hypothetical protein COI68_27180 [Priestia megaterium]